MGNLLAVVPKIKAKTVLTMVLIFISSYALAADNSGQSDIIGDFMTTNLKGLFGSSAGFWKMFILVDIALATVASVKSKNLLVFAGVFGTALIPGFLIQKFVFPGA